MNSIVKPVPRIVRVTENNTGGLGGPVGRARGRGMAGKPAAPTVDVFLRDVREAEEGELGLEEMMSPAPSGGSPEVAAKVAELVAAVVVDPTMDKATKRKKILALLDMNDDDPPASNALESRGNPRWPGDGAAEFMREFVEQGGTPGRVARSVEAQAGRKPAASVDKFLADFRAECGRS